MTQIYYFPGQGAQKVGMGEGLFEAFPEETARADAILGYSIAELCLQDPGAHLAETDYTQPALYVVSALTYLQRRQEGAPAPDLCAGHSLGEYNALFAAEVFDFATGLELVKERGQLMAAASGGGGGMAAVVGMAEDKLRATLDEAGFDDLDLANYNSPDQIAISGPRARIEEAKEAVTAGGALKYAVLNVGAAFHSRYMQEAADEFRAFLDGFTFQAPRMPVIANATALPYPDAASVPDLLAKQIAAPVRWVATLDYFLGLEDPQFEEMGPGRVLAGLLKRTLRARG